MSDPSQTPDRLFDHTWRPGHPLRPRVSRPRRWTMALIFLLLCSLIGGYWYLTDANRVRRMAEGYLSTLLSMPVHVDQAKLSLFEGLRLDGVRILSDKSGSNDSLLFSAESFLLQYDLRALLRGKIEATRIVAVEPRVHLTEDVDTGKRNYTRLLGLRAGGSMPTTNGGGVGALPEIVLRNAEVTYTRSRNGTVIEDSAIGVEGQLTPAPQGKSYTFSFQSRGRASEIGPIVSGQVDTEHGTITASLQNFEFAADVRAMLPPDVREWWEEHQLSGRVSVPVLSFTLPQTRDAALGYRIEIELQGVTLTAHPQEWMGQTESIKLGQLHAAFDALSTAGLNENHFVDHLAGIVEPGPVELKQVHGRFVFSDDQTIQIQGLTGYLEELPFKIDGKIDGYTPSAPAKIRVASSELHDIQIPAAPRYLNSMPPAVREIYDRFKPQGVCRFWIELNRVAAHERPHITGEIEIVDGNFAFDKFPYPLRNTKGRIVLTEDAATGADSLVIDHIRGRGIEGGPNADNVVDISGTIGPFGPKVKVNVLVVGASIVSEPAMMAAFPPVTQRALKLFDAPGHGEFPKFSGNFSCNVSRIKTPTDSHWNIDTNIHLNQAEGSLVGFPYPMSGVSGDLKVHDDFVELIGIHMQKGDANLQIDGRVSWIKPDEQAKEINEPKLKPDLTIAANNVPIDADLLNALPPARRDWLQKLGASGKIDIAGTIKPGGVGTAAPNDNLDLDLTIAMRDATFKPNGSELVISDVQGKFRLGDSRLTIESITGQRGDSELSARGEANWVTEPAQVVMQAQATNLLLDDVLYRSLGSSARAAWDQAQPQGTVDVNLNYSGAPADSGAGAAGYQIIFTPRELSVTPKAAPYRLDHVQGIATAEADKITLSNVHGVHGSASVQVNGDISGSGNSRAAHLQLAGQGMAMDDDFRRAIPPPLASLMKSLNLNGTFNFELSKLNVQTNPSAKPDANTDVDFAMKATTDSAAMDVGVPLDQVKGTIDLAGTAVAGKLSTLGGHANLDSFSLAGRPIDHFKAEFYKAANVDQLTIAKMEGRLAKGALVGQFDYAFPDAGAARYALTILLRDASVRDLTGETRPDLNGQLSASLALEGTANNPASRRGRGDVTVSGQQLYHIPLVLGLLQITNLALPITTPFNEASVRYSIEGMRVTFEDIELRSHDMVMQGDGNLQFDTKQVNMRFTTDSTTGLKLPLISNLISGAQHELLQIRVKGTLEQPQVSATSMNTLFTTVDEVLKAEDQPKPLKKSKPGPQPAVP